MHRSMKRMIIVIKHSTVTARRKRFLARFCAVKNFVQPSLVGKLMEEGNVWLQMGISSWHNSCNPDGQGGPVACTPGK